MSLVEAYAKAIASVQSDADILGAMGLFILFAVLVSAVSLLIIAAVSGATWAIAWVCEKICARLAKSDERREA